ncbi:hypothetical protein HOY82DRAFT_601658 [Tuber indicum]|nr:hypothetical protein HOY82DRAFT_601658 [Tuber indicum]
MAATMIDNITFKIVISFHVEFYSTDNYTSELTLFDGENMRDVIREYTAHTLETYATSKNVQFVGAGITLGHETISPGICPHIWRTQDVVCVLLEMRTGA